MLLRKLFKFLILCCVSCLLVGNYLLLKLPVFYVVLREFPFIGNNLLFKLPFFYIVMLEFPLIGTFLLFKLHVLKILSLHCSECLRKLFSSVKLQVLSCGSIFLLS